ncbi:MAG: GGDEF domain-containing phosphodiesterase, partial [Congregibacter sp.]|nr:GGDEF domain-containing phosphodiesterase [Congregibacter sp.]
DSGDPDHLLRHADQAMYLAKQKGKNCYHIFDIKKDVAIKYRNEKLARISRALSNNEFELYYQPKIDLTSRKVAGVEALIRWHHPEKGVLPPAEFLPEIERHTLGVEIGKWVIQAALDQLHEWQVSGSDVAISINISPLHLQHTSFVSDLKVCLEQYPDYRPGTLECEIVESSALNDVDLVSKIIKDCNELGVDFSIDDFGVGYSSLVYLKRLPVKYLKIDQSFVRDMLVDTDDNAIVQGIIELAKVFNLTVIAEGVETSQHSDVLLSLGCHLAQGYGIARPMPAGKLLPWLAEWTAHPHLVD